MAGEVQSPPSHPASYALQTRRRSASPAVIKNAVIINHDRIIDAATFGETAGTHVFEFMHETKGTRPADFPNKRLAADFEGRATRLLLEKPDGQNR